MAVVEYMMHRVDGGSRREVPQFIGDRGHWMSPVDNSFIGWIDEVRDYYVPDSIVTLTRQQFIDRQLAIHAAHPFSTPSGTATAGGERESRVLSVEEVTTRSGEWYDNFVNQNS